MKNKILISNTKIQYYCKNQEEFYDQANKFISAQLIKIAEIIESLNHSNLFHTIQKVEDTLALLTVYEAIAYYCFTGHYDKRYESQYKEFIMLTEKYYQFIYGSSRLKGFLKNANPQKKFPKEIKKFYLIKMQLYRSIKHPSFPKHSPDLISELQQLEVKFNENIHQSEQYWREYHHHELNYEYFKNTMLSEKSSDIRKSIYIAYYTRASKHFPAKEFDNTSIMQKMLALRYQLAQSLNYRHYADMAITNNIHSSYTDIRKILNKLIENKFKTARKYFNYIQNIESNSEVKKIHPWDFDYYLKSFLNNNYSVSHDTHTACLQLNHCLEVLFEICSKNFHLELTTEKKHECIVIKLHKKHKIIGVIYLDLLNRASKQNIIWTAAITSKHHFIDGRQIVPQVIVQTNFMKEDNAHCYRISLHNLIILFHEFGHALHGVLSQAHSVSLSELNNSTLDILEFPSQYMENFCLEPSVLEDICKLELGSSTLSKNEIATLLSRYKITQSFNDLFQLQLSIFDLELHTQVGYKDLDIEKFYRQIVGEYSLIKPSENIAFTNSFFHSFSNHYAANYHCYTLAQNRANHHFKLNKHQNIFNVDWYKQQ